MRKVAQTYDLSFIYDYIDWDTYIQESCNQCEEPSDIIGEDGFVSWVVENYPNIYNRILDEYKNSEDFLWDKEHTPSINNIEDLNTSLIYEVIVESPDIRQLEQEYIRVYLETEVLPEFLDEISHIDFNQPFKLWRAVSLNVDAFGEYLLDMDNVGIYWTYNMDEAQAHWGKFGAERKVAILEGIFTKDDIDWQGTLDAQMSYNTGPSEDELRVKKGTKFTLTKMYDGDSGAMIMELNMTATASNEYTKPVFAVGRYGFLEEYLSLRDSIKSGSYDTTDLRYLNIKVRSFLDAIDYTPTAIFYDITTDDRILVDLIVRNANGWSCYITEFKSVDALFEDFYTTNLDIKELAEGIDDDVYVENIGLYNKLKNSADFVMDYEEIVLLPKSGKWESLGKQSAAVIETLGFEKELQEHFIGIFNDFCNENNLNDDDVLFDSAFDRLESFGGTFHEFPDTIFDMFQNRILEYYNLDPIDYESTFSIINSDDQRRKIKNLELRIEFDLRRLMEIDEVVENIDEIVTRAAEGIIYSDRLSIIFIWLDPRSYIKNIKESLRSNKTLLTLQHEVIHLVESLLNPAPYEKEKAYYKFDPEYLKLPEEEKEERKFEFYVNSLNEIRARAPKIYEEIKHLVPTEDDLKILDTLILYSDTYNFLIEHGLNDENREYLLKILVGEFQKKFKNTNTSNINNSFFDGFMEFNSTGSLMDADFNLNSFIENSSLYGCCQSGECVNFALALTTFLESLGYKAGEDFKYGAIISDYAGNDPEEFVQSTGGKYDGIIVPHVFINFKGEDIDSGKDYIPTIMDDWIDDLHRFGGISTADVYIDYFIDFNILSELLRDDEVVGYSIDASAVDRMYWILKDEYDKILNN